MNVKKKQRHQYIAALSIFAAIIAVDQILKLWVKTHLYLSEHIRITDWFYLVFTENNGMAFGMEFIDKIWLTSFRLIAVVFLFYYIGKVVRNGISWGYLLCLVLVTAGAAGNLVDCLFYGMILSNPPAPFVADFVPWGMGYESLFYGRVVDMFYFPLVSWTWPAWIPLVGGQSQVFFSPIFNFADAAISCGVVALLLFYRKRLIS